MSLAKLRAAIEAQSQQSPARRGAGGGGGGGGGDHSRNKKSVIEVSLFIFVLLIYIYEMSFFYQFWWFVTSEPKEISRVSSSSSSSTVQVEEEEEIVQGFVIGGATFSIRKYLTGVEAFPESELRQMATQYFFQNRLPDLLQKLPLDERILAPITDPHKNPYHLVFLCQQQAEESIELLKRLFALQGKPDSANTNSFFDVVVVRKNSTLIFFFLIFFHRKEKRSSMRRILNFLLFAKKATVKHSQII